jgi:hypothetical protein
MSRHVVIFFHSKPKDINLFCCCKLLTSIYFTHAKTPKHHAVKCTSPRECIYHRPYYPTQFDRESFHNFDRQCPSRLSISESLNKVAQLGQLIEQLLQLVVRYLCLQARNQRLGFLCVVAAQTAYNSFFISKRLFHRYSDHPSGRLTKL